MNKKLITAITLIITLLIGQCKKLNSSPLNYYNMASGLATGIQMTGEGIIAGWNTGQQEKTNTQQRLWSERMYARQRFDALQDWNRENDYNSPTAQMARLKKAGLNPNLVYGNGANAQGGQIRSTSPESWHPTAPKIDGTRIGETFLNDIATHADLRVKSEQADNIKANTGVAMQDAILRGIQIKKEVQDYDLKDKQFGWLVDASRLNVEKMKKDLGVGDATISELNTRSALNESKIGEVKSHIGEMNAHVNQILTDTRFTKHQDIRSEKLNNAQIDAIKIDMATKLKSWGLTDAQISEAKAKTLQIIEETKHKSNENVFDSLYGSWSKDNSIIGSSARAWLDLYRSGKNAIKKVAGGQKFRTH